MNIKTLIQALMFFLIIVISFIFYLEYFNKNPKSLKVNTITKKIDIDENSSSNYIDDINYISSDTKGNKYQITAKKAEIDIDNPDLMFLENIVANVFIKYSDPVKIISDFGKYNSKNYDTVFSKNVIITYPDHKITGEYLDFSFINNLGTISRNVVYTGNKTKMFADKIEINITTKNTKIFMNDNNKKVLVKGTN
jgi:LPS export ABC transporter protein LptC